MKVYRVCSGNTNVDIQTTLTKGMSQYWYSVYNNGYSKEYYKIPLTVTLNQASPVNFTYNYYQTVKITHNGTVMHTGGEYKSINIPAGTTVVHYDALSKNVETNSAYTTVYEVLTITEGAQSYVPVCYIPPECNLVLSAVTYTTPSVKYASDATLTISWTTTGDTPTIYVNGNSYGNGNTSPFTITGLTAGQYVVYLEAPYLGDYCTDTDTAIIPDGELRTGDYIITQPRTVCAVENPVQLSVSTGIVSTSPLQSINVFTITGATVSGVTIDFALTYPYIYNARIESKGYPDREDYFLESILLNDAGTPVGTNSTTEIATSLAEAFQLDGTISRLYYITNSGTTVTLKSKEYNSKYDLSTANVSIVGSGIVLANTQSGRVRWDGQVVSNYSVYAELFVDTDLQFGATPVLDNFSRIIELELPFNSANNKHVFDLSSVLKNFVSSPKIDFSFTGFTTLGNMDCCYYCKYGEKYPLVENTNTKKKRYKGSTDVLYVLNSALDFESPNDMSGYTGTLVSTGSTVVTGVTFMNTAPNPKFIQRNSKEWLYFLLTTSYPNYLDLRGDIYFYNGQSLTGQTFFTITNSGNSVNFGGVTILACGYDELGLAVYENSGNTKIRRIDFAVWQTPSTGGTSTQLTETRSYLLEIDEQPDMFNVAFLNSLGTYETYSFVGEVIEGEEVVRQQYQTPYDVSDNGQAMPGFIYNGVYDTQYTKTWTVNSGSVDASTYYYLMELLKSNRIYNYSNAHQNYLTITSQNAVKSSNNNEYTVQIVFKETIYENQVEK